MDYTFKGTKGPWRVATKEDNHCIGVLDNGDLYNGVIGGAGCYVPDGKGFSIAAIMSEEDTHLLAAAPDLLEACKFLLDTMIENPSIEGRYWEFRIEVAKQAIEKALNIQP